MIQLIDKQIKNNKVESFKCVMCKKYFLRHTKPNKSNRRIIARRFGAINCSRRCAMDFLGLTLTERKKIREKINQKVFKSKSNNNKERK